MLDTDERDMRDALDEGIRGAVAVLRRAGIETFESCEGGSGHAYPEPTVRFHGQHPEGFRALAAALVDQDEIGFRVGELPRDWRLEDGEPTGPWWELTFRPRMPVGSMR
jgi:hypothetical protein